VKHSQRLEHPRLASALVERGLCDAKKVEEALHIAENGHGSFPEVLVNSSLVSDWELSRVVCEVYNLPFVTAEIIDPDPAARKDLDLQFLAHHGLVPLARSNSVLTIAMPGMVAADVLGEMAATTDLTILPVVGSVQTNRRWIEKVLLAEMKAALPTQGTEAVHEAHDAGWDQLFDAAEAAVQEPAMPAAPLPSMRTVAPVAASTAMRPNVDLPPPPAF